MKTNFEKWEEEINQIERDLKKQKIFLNVAKKVDFLTNYFDKENLISILFSYGRKEKNETICKMSFAVSYKNNEYKVINSDEILYLKIDIALPQTFNHEKTDGKYICFKNTEEGINDFEMLLLGKQDLVSEYKMFMLDKILGSEQNKKQTRNNNLTCFF